MVLFLQEIVLSLECRVSKYSGRLRRAKQYKNYIYILFICSMYIIRKCECTNVHMWCHRTIGSLISITYAECIQVVLRCWCYCVRCSCCCFALFYYISSFFCFLFLSCNTSGLADSGSWLAYKNTHSCFNKIENHCTYLNIESIHHELVRGHRVIRWISDPIASIFKFAYCFKLVRNNIRIREWCEHNEARNWPEVNANCKICKEMHSNTLKVLQDDE